MPTIEQLESVIVASDDDSLPVSQGGVVRRVTRSQLLEGTQSTLSVTPGLIGRVSPGLGPPEQVTIGTGLSLSDGVLSGNPLFSPAVLPLSTSVGVADLVPTSQNGKDSAVSVRTLLSVAGIDVSNQVAKASVGTARRIADWLGDAVAVESFGARGDGVTDDTNAINFAIASGRPVLFAAKTYRVDGQWNIQEPTTLIGTIGQTVLRRNAQSGGAWISITAPRITSIGIIFDAGGLGGDSWAVLVGAGCLKSFFDCCVFSNSTGAILGSGLTIQARGSLNDQNSSHIITNCSFKNNTCHGVWIQAASNAEVSNCQASNNGAFGVCLDYNDPLFQQTVRRCRVINSKCWNNARGISVGNYNESNLEPPRWGLANPDATDIVVSGNLCVSNSSYGIAVSGARIQVVHNQVLIEDPSAAASGILVNASLTTVESNSVVGPGQFGIDSGGCADAAITSNTVTGCAVGINAGGSSRVHLARNNLINNTRAITIFQVETDGKGTNFGIACSDIWIEDNLLQIDSDGGGIFLFDGPERIEIARNRFLSTPSTNAESLCWTHTNTATVRENSWNGSRVADASSHLEGTAVQLTVPDIVDSVWVSSSITSVDALFGLHQLAMSGRVSFIKVVQRGEGYTQATVVIKGAGSGARAAAYLRDGVVIGIGMSGSGSGYDLATTSVDIIGDGVGASLQPVVGLPVPQDRRIALHCLGPVRFFQDNTGVIQAISTGADTTVAAGTDVILQGTGSGWQVVSFASIDYVQPGGDGSVTFRSSRGDLRFSAGPGGVVRFCSDVEQAGFVTCCGRGSPEGAVIAPPGSDYRNLSGGPGATLWLKRVGTDSSGWFPLA